MGMESPPCPVPSHSPTDNLSVWDQTYQCRIATEQRGHEAIRTALIPSCFPTFPCAEHAAFQLSTSTLPQRKSRNGKIIRQFNPCAGSVPAQSKQIPDSISSISQPSEYTLPEGSQCPDLQNVVIMSLDRSQQGLGVLLPRRKHSASGQANLSPIQLITCIQPDPSNESTKIYM